MKKIYLIVPLLLLAAFAVFYHGYRKEADAKALVDSQVLAERQAAETRQRTEYQTRVAEEARQTALAKQKAEADKVAERLAREKQWEEMSRAMDTLTSERDAEAQHSFDLSSTLRDEQDLLERAKNRMSVLSEEKKFLDSYLPAARANRARIQSFLEQVEAAKKAATATPASTGRSN